MSATSLHKDKATEDGHKTRHTWPSTDISQDLEFKERRRNRHSAPLRDVSGLVSKGFHGGGMETLTSPTWKSPHPNHSDELNKQVWR